VARGRCPWKALVLRTVYGTSTHHSAGDASGHACLASGARLRLHDVVSRRGSRRGAPHAEPRITGRCGTHAHRRRRAGAGAARDSLCCATGHAGTHVRLLSLRNPGRPHEQHRAHGHPHVHAVRSVSTLPPSARSLARVHERVTRDFTIAHATVQVESQGYGEHETHF
jgi:hypothetical protein